MSLCARGNRRPGGGQTREAGPHPAGRRHARHARLRRLPRAEGRSRAVHDSRRLPRRFRHGRRQGQWPEPGRHGLRDQAVRRLRVAARVRAALRTKHLQDLLIEYAHIDPLTGLPNRRASWNVCSRNGSEWFDTGADSFIMADIDHFKRINDTYGHNIGDQMFSRSPSPSPGNAGKPTCPPATAAKSSPSSSPARRSPPLFSRSGAGKTSRPYD